MSEGVAFKSTAQSVLDAWRAYQDHVEDVDARRSAMVDRYGRDLMVNREGFSHGTRVTGFELYEDDKPGDLVGDAGELRVPKGGRDAHVVRPNLARKAGKNLATELGTLILRGPELPGMPGWTLIGLSLLRPAIFLHDDTVWVRWAGDPDRGTQHLDTDEWEKQPLSAYYAAREAYDAAREAVSAA